MRLQVLLFIVDVSLWLLILLPISCCCDAFLVLSSRSPTSTSTTHTRTRGRSSPSLGVSSRVDIEQKEVGVIEDETRRSSRDNNRPLQQNWWPVVAMSALDPTKPNSVQVLGKSLVAFQASQSAEDDYNSSSKDKTSSSWSVLDDMCSHRFAPLSEGRVIVNNNNNKDDNDGGDCNNNNIQCAYHGWEFDQTGKCTRVPQASNDSVQKARKVKNYPTQIAVGILWVWMDPATAQLGTSISLPIDPMLQKYVNKYGDAACFMRDLPYGMEILGENLIDLSHLPYAHHSLGSLDRKLGQSLPTKMMSSEEKINYSQWEKDFIKDDQQHEPVIPTFQAEILDSAIHDPILMPFAKGKDATETKEWKTTISYFSPCHVRYRRTRGGPSESGNSSSHVELFMCPRSESRSRVFLFNVFESLLTDDSSNDNDKTNKQQWNKERSSIMSKIKLALISKLLDPRRVGGHMIAHQIFDGDGIFLHMQGNRMKANGLSYTNYSTPSSADVMLNAYRRHLATLAKVTRGTEGGGSHNNNLASVADAVVGSGGYGDDMPRSMMLDRYNTHTVYCPTCSTALKNTRKQKSRMELVQTAVTGAAGASTTVALIIIAAARFMGAPILTAAASGAGPASLPTRLLFRLTASTAGAAWLGSFLTNRKIKKLDKKINSFLFEDYVHAEKD